MIPKAREVRLKPKTRKVLEARCRAPTTAQRDVKRARIVLLAAEGRSTRSIAEEVGVQPRIVSNWRRRFAEHGIGGLQDRPRAGKKPIYGKATNKRILALLDKPPPQGYARWTGPLLAKALGDVDVQYVWRFLREHTIDLAARKSWCESNDPSFVAKAADVVGLYVDPPVKAIVLCVDEKPSIQALERAQGYLKLPNGRALTGQSSRLQAARHHDLVRSARSRHRQDHRSAFQAPPPCRVPRLHEQRRRRLPGSRASRHPRQSQHAQEEPALAQETSHCPFPFHPDPIVMAQSDRNVVFNSPGPVAERRILHRHRAIAGAHRCVHRSIQ